ncbi:MAG: maleylacetoacetate isomerase [Pseudomonadota bacterium]
MKLYTYFRSSAAFRVRIALNIKNIAYEPVFVHLAHGAHLSDEYRAANPQGLIPALAVDGAVLSQSLAIIDYLEETHPAPALLPGDPLARARVRAMALAIACDIHPLNNLRVLKYLHSTLEHDQKTIDAWYRHWIVAGFTALEAWAARHGGAGHCFGETVTVADVCLVPQMWNARRFKTDLSPFPTLERIDAHLQSLPAFAAAAPENQPDFA